VRVACSFFIGSDLRWSQVEQDVSHTSLVPFLQKFVSALLLSIITFVVLAPLCSRCCSWACVYHHQSWNKANRIYFICKLWLSIQLFWMFTVHYLRWRMSPFMRQCWGLPHRLAQCMRPQGWGKLVNATLLSLINEACVNVCCTTLLSSELVGPACVQARSSYPRGRVCRLSGKGSGRRGYWV